MNRGREAYRSNREPDDLGPACAVGATCRCIETWLLADSRARKEIFGSDAEDPFSDNPEQRPHPRRLKQYIEDHCDEQHLDRSSVYEDLARSARPEELERRCPTSYPPFAADVSAEIAPLLR